MTTIETEISKGLVEDLISEFLTKTKLEHGEISDIELGPRYNSDKNLVFYKLKYTTKEEEVNKTVVN